MGWLVLSVGLMMAVFWLGTMLVWAVKEWTERDMGQAQPPEPLPRGRARPDAAEEHGWKNVQLIQGDAAEVEKVVASPVDGVISTACLCIVPGWERAIAGAAALLRPRARLAVLGFLTMKPKGPLGILAPLVEWWTEHYGFADPGVHFSEVRPWKETMEKYLTNVTYGERYFGTMFVCYGQKA